MDTVPIREESIGGIESEAARERPRAPSIDTRTTARQLAGAASPETTGDYSAAPGNATHPGAFSERTRGSVHQAPEWDLRTWSRSAPRLMRAAPAMADGRFRP